MVRAKQQQIDDEGVFTELTTTQTALTATQTKLGALQNELAGQQMLLGQCSNENKHLREQISDLTRQKMSLEEEKTTLLTKSKSILVPELPSPEKKEDTSPSTSTESIAQLKVANAKVCYYVYCLLFSSLTFFY